MQNNYSDFLEFNEPENLTNYFVFPEAFTVEEIAKVESLVAELKPIESIAGGVVNKDYRSSEIRWIPNSEDSHWLYQKLGALGNQANKEIWNFSIATMSENIQYGEYRAEDNGHYDWHLDIGKGSFKRKISLCVQLSDPDDYEGGDLELLFGRNVQQVPRGQGNVALFPSFALHRVTPVTKGTRKSLVIWISGEPFR